MTAPRPLDDSFISTCRYSGECCGMGGPEISGVCLRHMELLAIYEESVCVRAVKVLQIGNILSDTLDLRNIIRIGYDASVGCRVFGEVRIVNVALEIVWQLVSSAAKYDRYNWPKFGYSYDPAPSTLYLFHGGKFSAAVVLFCVPRRIYQNHCDTGADGPCEG